jgi:hypothetical protein
MSNLTERSTMEKDLNILMKELQVIDNKYAPIHALYDFNIFSILRKDHEEVMLHSRFISELLNVQGSHGMGIGFLKAFCSHFGIDDWKSQNFENSKCHFEKYTGRISPDGSKGGNIDIIVEDSKKESKAIVIENKIYAKDQDQQLLRYYNTLDKKCHLFYLTLYGDEPSDLSTNEGELKPEYFTNISYSDVANWLDKCIEIAVRSPTVRETLIQYQNLIMKITGKTATVEEREELMSLLSKQNNAILACKIVQNWDYLRHHIELTFFKMLEESLRTEKLINSESDLDQSYLYNSDKIFQALSKKKDSYWFGIKWDINVDNVSEEDNKKLAFRIQRGNENLTYALDLSNNGDKVILGEMKTKFKDLKSWDNTWGAILMEQFDKVINFNEPQNENIIAMANEDQMKKVVNEIVLEFKDFHDQVMSVIDKTNN